MEGADLNVNYLGEELGNAMVEGLPAEPVLKRYTDGGQLRQYVFGVSLRRACGEDILQNLAAAEAIEQMGSWIEQQSAAGHLPVLDNGAEPIELEVLEAGSAEEQTNMAAKYLLRCRLIYRQEY